MSEHRARKPTQAEKKSSKKGSITEWLRRLLAEEGCPICSIQRDFDQRYFEEFVIEKIS